MSTSIKADQLLDKYRNMIRKAAWGQAKTWNMDFEECESQGYLIFMEALGRFEEGRASFSTYLCSELRRIGDFCEKENNAVKRSTPFIDDRYEVGSANGWSDGQRITNEGQCTGTTVADNRFDKFISSLEHVESQTKLSQDAKMVLKYIFDGDWGAPGSTLKPSLFSAQTTFRKLGWKPARTKKAWDEIHDWWNMEQTA